jgi:hypothetical protein
MVHRPVALGRSMNRAASTPDPTVVCVLGMHRSGTSVVSRLLNLLGVYLGPERSILSPGVDNPKGYWENHPISLLNDEILARYGGRWDKPVVFPDGWLQSPEVADLQDKARDILAGFAGQALWGWKDPRTCLTLPFWQDLIGPMRYVLAFRNPGEVIASLQRRNAMDVEKAERLWLAHVHASLTDTSGQKRMFVFYDDIMNDYATELARMAAFVGRPDAAEDPAVGTAAADFLEETLFHHRTSMADLAGDRRVSFPVTGLYLAVRGHAPRPTSNENGAGQDRAQCNLHKTLDALGTRAVEAWDLLAASTAERDALARANHEQADTIARLSGTVVHLTESLASLRLEREAANVMVYEIHASAAWTLVTRARGVIVRLFPAGTGRRRALDVVLRRIAPRRPSARSQAPVDSLTT